MCRGSSVPCLLLGGRARAGVGELGEFSYPERYGTLEQCPDDATGGLAVEPGDVGCVAALRCPACSLVGEPGLVSVSSASSRTPSGTGHSSSALMMRLAALPLSLVMLDVSRFFGALLAPCWESRSSGSSLAMRTHPVPSAKLIPASARPARKVGLM